MTGSVPTTYLTDALGPLPFCPGCGHERILEDLDRAMVNLRLEPRETVIVSDIGCIGLADRYFTTSAFHGLHGRSLTYATGLKLARPELTVIVLMGDGGCGIGGTHLLNAARRNVDLTLIVANNFNYGMTGGQHSVTTPTGGVTATTPGGNIEGAMDVCATAIGAGATWVYRGVAHDRDLPDRITGAITHPGFAMLDIWELCTAYYLPRNDLNKKKLYALVESSGLEVGLLASQRRPEFGAAYRERSRSLPSLERAAAIEPAFSSELARQTGIVIAGSAGQKIQSTATLLARAGLLSGLMASQKDDHPITVMTGHSLCEVILSPDPIDYTGIEAPDHVVVLSADGLKKTGARIRALDPAATVIIDRDLDCPETAARVVALPIAKTARAVGRLSLAAVAVGALLEETGLIPRPALETAIRRYQKPEIAEGTLRAARAGAALIASPDATRIGDDPRPGRAR